MPPILENNVVNVKTFKERNRLERESRAFYHADCVHCAWNYRPSTRVELEVVEARARAHRHQEQHDVDILFDLLDQFVDRVRANPDEVRR